MDILQLTPVQKSVALAGLIPEWEVLLVWSWGDAWAINDRATGNRLLTVNIERSGLSLYSVDENGNPKFMPLNWRILNWAMTKQDWLPALNGNMGWLSDHVTWLFDEHLLAKPPAAAQAAWLDKVLELAITAGLVETPAA